LSGFLKRNKLSNRWPGLPTKQVAGVTQLDFVQNHNYITKLG